MIAVSSRICISLSIPKKGLSLHPVRGRLGNTSLDVLWHWVVLQCESLSIFKKPSNLYGPPSGDISGPWNITAMVLKCSGIANPIIIRQLMMGALHFCSETLDRDYTVKEMSVRTRPSGFNASVSLRYSLQLKHVLNFKSKLSQKIRSLITLSATNSSIPAGD